MFFQLCSEVSLHAACGERFGRPDLASCRWFHTFSSVLCNANGWGCGWQIVSDGTNMSPKHVKPPCCPEVADRMQTLLGRTIELCMKKNMQHGPDWCLSITKDCFIHLNSKIDFFMGIIIFQPGIGSTPNLRSSHFWVSSTCRWNKWSNTSLKEDKYIYIYTLNETIPACAWQINEIVYIYIYIFKWKYTHVSKLVPDFFRPVFAYIYIMNVHVCINTFVSIHA